ncbi:uncharacterized protein LOC111694218 [Trichogramma pretiosum]|uniref:uncharacterized protein LOC111694218 n=1 Tax=Trichogramma pretiosum TaxID=7493 RepID=UPI000C718DA7|nr:uncharacterized protein LOC111694218 [Trichogramma pretiosum]
MDFKKINQLAKSKATYLPLKKVTDLMVDRDYKVTAIKKAVTKYGPKILLQLNQEFQMFLPKQVSDALLDTCSAIKIENLYIKSADNTLAEKALERVRARDSSIGEKIAALAVAGAMKIKKGLGVKLAKVVTAAKKNMKRGKTSESVIKSAISGAREAVKKAGERKKVKIPRVLPVSGKIGGALPFLIPLFAGLSAVGALGGGAAGIAKAVNDAKAAERELHEMKKHNRKMEAIALGKGLYLKPYKTGLGLCPS